MPAGAGDLKGVTTNSEHLLFRIIIYLCLIFIPTASFALLPKRLETVGPTLRLRLPPIYKTRKRVFTRSSSFRLFFFFFLGATPSGSGLHPSDSELGLLRWPVLIPSLFAHSSLRTPFAPTNPPFAWIFQTAFMPPFFSDLSRKGISSAKIPKQNGDVSA